MLSIAKSGVFSSRYDISENGDERGSVSIRGWRSEAEIQVAGTTYQAVREGFFRQEYLLEQDGREIASAEPVGFWSRSYEVQTISRTFQLKREGWIRSAFVFKDGDSVLGRVERVSAWTSKFEAEFDREIAVELQCFVIYVAMMAWRQEQAAAG